MADAEPPEGGWGLPGSLRALYLGLFAVLMLAGSSLLCWYELFRRPHDGPVETFIAAAQGIGMMSLASAGLSASLIELGRSIMVVAHYLDQRLKKRQEERLARAEAAASAAARAETQQMWEEWNSRRLAAEAAGLPFDEPPPSLHSNGREE